jgi:hypothetical protein
MNFEDGRGACGAFPDELNGLPTIEPEGDYRAGAWHGESLENARW